MPISLRPLDRNQEIIPPSAFRLVIEISENTEISVFRMSTATPPADTGRRGNADRLSIPSAQRRYSTD
jgi:hypothetical protein